MSGSFGGGSRRAGCPARGLRGAATEAAEGIERVRAPILLAPEPRRRDLRETGGVPAESAALRRPAPHAPRGSRELSGSVPFRRRNWLGIRQSRAGAGGRGGGGAHRRAVSTMAR